MNTTDLTTVDDFDARRFLEELEDTTAWLAERTGESQ